MTPALVEAERNTRNAAVRSKKAPALIKRYQL
ncbi:hypothetical protein CLHUN_33430 [Ruminiclostridium hungatei]|uniref:Uncharacterized protein n=1 Tax=Ruminiclostridium hungatei TaxID=48256 RepID=A0A1V4SHH4_RUMHU|nr:hypothetical protein CLHUN_33430 [Ruminiclostridium hungatei]